MFTGKKTSELSVINQISIPVSSVINSIVAHH